MRRGEVWLVRFGPTVGSEIRKTRPAVIVSPDSANRRLDGVIIVPPTSSLHSWPMRIRTSFEGRRGEAALDQIRAVDKNRLLKSLGMLNETELREILRVLQNTFAY